jgi:pyruvate/2-oxoglutarate dehydrogenase complex dihydrolipoamide acyltransferase (E2) component
VSAKDNGYTIKPLPKRRRLVKDIGWLARSRHSMKGLIEVDITDARSRIRRLRRESGRPLSFTAFLVSTVAHAIAQNPEVNACHTRMGRIAYFDKVNVVAMIEVVNTDGLRIPIGHLIPAAEDLEPTEIEQIIEKYRSTYNEASETKMLDVVTSLPAFLRRFLFGQMPKNPKFIQKTMGTVVVSAVGMFLPKHAAWAVGQGNHTISIWVGSTVERICKLRGELVPRTFGCISIDIDHDIIDGAPAARFTAALVEMIEKASVLH